MTNIELEIQKPPVSPWKVKAFGLLTSMSFLLVASVSAAIDLSGIVNVTDDVALLFVPLVAVVIAAIPIMIVLAIVGFILGLFDAILGKIRV